MKILFGIFDWGLGHATRDIPLITELLKSNEVHILSTGRALKLAQGYFGDKCTYYDVPSIYVPYTRTPFFKTMFAFSAPRMVTTLRKARKRSKKIIDQGFDKVISDCRYDVYDRQDNSYLINHQLRFSTPFGAERAVEKWLDLRMRKYKYVIVPDFDQPNLSGRLSHNLRYESRDKIKYIGILSHVKKKDVPEDIDYLISISGPEPQRSIFYKKIMRQVNQLDGKVVIAGGNPDSAETSNRDNVVIYSFLNSEQQGDVMNRARFIISRPGYTTVMELAEIDKKRVLFMPTPGQTEQEYLADYYEELKYYHHVSQYRLRLKGAIEKSKQFDGFTPAWKTEQSVRNFMEVISS
ncbi:MAG: glycosyltransferase [Sedimentisphaerales bacterium]